jgi:hypothetical protein
MKGVILNLGSDGSSTQFPFSGTVEGVYGPIEKDVANELMKKNGGHPVVDKTDEWTVGERDFLGRTFNRVLFVFVPMQRPKDLTEKIRRLKDG